jgi:predicted dienelactone hydrolase
MKIPTSRTCRCARAIRYGAVLVLLLLTACGSPAATTRETTATVPEATSTLPQPTAERVAPTVTPEPIPLPLSAPGPYHVGRREVAAEDASRGNRQVSLTVWYPAPRPADTDGSRPTWDADPDRSGAPYPLLLSSTKMAGSLAPILVSHGFAWASVNGLDTYEQMNEQMIDQPLDILFALDQVATHPPEGLEGVIDAEHAGAIGYSFDGYNALALSGARIDPAFYLSLCASPDATKETRLSSFSCAPAHTWDEYAAHAGEAITTSENGLWQPMTDARIRAVVPMAGEGWWLFGERGLAAVDRPVLIVVATRDELYAENAGIFEHLGTPDKVLISFVGPGHLMVYRPEMIARMAHFAVAFFGVHLQGRDDYAQYYSEEFVARYPDLAWGVVPGE